MYRGGRRQRGAGIGGVFKSLFRSAVPFLQEGAKIVGKHAMNMGQKVLQDTMAGKDALKSFEMHGKKAALDTGTELLNKAGTVAFVEESSNSNTNSSNSNTKKRKRPSGKTVSYRSAKRQKGRGFQDIFDNDSSGS